MWQRQACLSNYANDFRAYEALQSLITAAWFRILFIEDLPWPSPEEQIEMLGVGVPHMNATL
jgi:hypothetical protein